MVLLFIAAVLSMATRRVRVPFPVVLVLVGLALGELVRFFPALQPIADLKLSSTTSRQLNLAPVLTYIFLPVLTFEAAFIVDARLLTRNLTPVLVLAVPATFVSALVAGGGLHLAMGFPLAAAALFGALISSTDGTAVLAVFRAVGAPVRLKVLAEGENLLNDATSIVLFNTVVALVGVGAAGALSASTLSASAWMFAANFVGGLLVGFAAGAVCGKLVGMIDDDDLIEIMLTTVIAFLAFVTAEKLFHVSGAIAVVGAGLVLGSWG